MQSIWGLNPIANVDSQPQKDCTDIMAIHQSEDQETTELQGISTLQDQDAYCR